tara:strand:+ start:438 stop:638 length:201 start_codon:yes stop_codon:yes gene_type:complete
MKDLELKTIIMILKNTQTGKPMVVTHFTGFEDETEAWDFTEKLKEKYINDIDYPIEEELESDPTLH